MAQHSHLHYVGSTTNGETQAVLLVRACAPAGKRLHQPFGPLNRIVLTDDFWLDEDMMNCANHAWDRQEKEAVRVAAHEARETQIPLF